MLTAVAFALVLSSCGDAPEQETSTADSTAVKTDSAAVVADSAAVDTAVVAK